MLSESLNKVHRPRIADDVNLGGKHVQVQTPDAFYAKALVAKDAGKYLVLTYVHKGEWRADTVARNHIEGLRVFK